MQPAIRVENLSKLYRLGSGVRGRYRTLRETITDAVSAPWRRFRQRTFAPGAAEAIWALNDVSFEVQPGEVVGIIGRNGSGKSTLLKILSRITEPTNGRVELRGRVGSLLEVGTGFHPELTGRENIYLSGAILGMTWREVARKFNDIVAFAEIEQFLDTPVKRYSSGMYVRLAFAVAAHLEPEILLVDEVLAVGDLSFQRKCMSKMGEVSRTGRTVLFVSHNMAAILNLCESVVLLDQGCVTYTGSCAEGVRRYTSQSAVRSGGDIDLTEHPNRRSGYSSFFKRARLLNKAGEVTTEFLCGEALTIEFIVAAATQTRFNFFVEVHDSLGTRLFTVGTHLSESGPLKLDDVRRVVCRIDGLPLVPGRYSFSVKARAPHKQSVDVIDQVAWFDVIPSDYYGNGRLPQASQGHFLVRSTWAVDAAPEQASSREFLGLSGPTGRGDGHA
jgi:lipopolysaccharide transport system ATP-binding protein